MSNPDDKNEIVGEDAVNAWLDRVRIISVKAVSPSALKGRSLPFATRWPVSYAVAADLDAISIDADTMAAAAFAAANLRAWADYVEKTGDGLRVEPYSISVDTPLDRHIGMAPLASCGSVGWRHAPKLQHRNRGFGDHGDHPWSDHHKHGAHPPLPRLDVPPPEPPCPRCAMEVYICRCDEDDLRDAIRERDAQIEALRVGERCCLPEEGYVETDNRLRPCPWAGCQIWLTEDPCYDEIEYDEQGFATTTIPTIPDAAATVTRRCIVDLFDDLTVAAENNASCPRCDSPTGPYNGFGLAGGGFGAYAGCYACDVIVKVQTPDDDAPEGA